MGETFVLVEYRYDDVEGNEYPQVFVGTSDECEKLMVKRYDKFRKLYDKDEAWSFSEPEDGRAVCQEADGNCRVEWWIRDANEDAEYMGAKR